jgi:hypothetical protein
MENETNIKIKLTPDGNHCTLQIVEEEAKKGTRLDQRIAQMILELDELVQNPQFMQAMQSMQAQQGQHARWSNPSQRPMTPFGGIPSPNPTPGFFGGGPGMNFGQNTGY